MMAVIITKMFFLDDFSMPTDCWSVKVVLPSYCWPVILTFYRPTEGRQRGGGSVKVLPTSLTTTHVWGLVKLLLLTYCLMLIMNRGVVKLMLSEEVLLIFWLKAYSYHLIQSFFFVHSLFLLAINSSWSMFRRKERLRHAKHQYRDWYIEEYLEQFDAI
jgi:hypothetical protein